MTTIWQQYSSDSREQYVAAIKALGALSALFRQKADGTADQTAYISSKYQETVFARFFNGTVVDKGNDPYDVMIPSSVSGKRDLVGIKTFLNSSSSMQKIMQFKSVATTEGWTSWIKDGEYQRLVTRIAELRNQKLRSTQNLLAGVGIAPEDAFANIFYHYLSPLKDGRVYVGESDYSFMDESNLSYKAPNESKRISSLLFNDGKNEYKYTPADSTLYMRFVHTRAINNGGDIVDEFAVRQLDDPYASLMRLLESGFAELLSPGHPERGNSDVVRGRRRAIKSTVETVVPVVVQQPKLDVENVSMVPADGSPRSRSKNKAWAPDLTADMTRRASNKEVERPVIFPIFRLTKYGETPAGEVDAKSGLNVRLGASKNKGSGTRRPVNEVEIKIPEPRKFYEEFPRFFGVNDNGEPISKLKRVGSKWQTVFENIDDRTFELVLSQSGQKMDAILTGDGNKQLMSKHHQDTLGGWILSQVFQLGEYELLDRNKLDQLELDCIKLTRLGNRRVGMEFIKITEEELEFLWPPKQDLFRQLWTPTSTDEA
ncbi:hypothetical protein [Glutamicibacter sp. HZAU]|uniref:hypothetical protein n=1 Tax=Glutamicibacter sp. HZAU TaxID=2049891 RepID=UPI000FFBB815|nr:hypothetical protein [Glutamicibacter sp. HZAU]RWZ85306.1 hypothetical protein EKH49_02030 [Glutamicibacter sp. HZAU]